MGLDQVAFALENDTELGSDKALEEQEDIITWRKHPNLQGYMEKLWRSRGGEGEFNCVTVELRKQDIYALRSAIQGKNLPETQGFFYGSDSDYYYLEDDLLFCSIALERIKEGKKIYYSSWW